MLLRTRLSGRQASRSRRTGCAGRLPPPARSGRRAGSSRPSPRPGRGGSCRACRRTAPPRSARRRAGDRRENRDGVRAAVDLGERVVDALGVERSATLEERVLVAEVAVLRAAARDDDGVGHEIRWRDGSGRGESAESFEQSGRKRVVFDADQPKRGRLPGRNGEHTPSSHSAHSGQTPLF